MSSSLKVALFTGNYNHIRDGVSLTLNRMVSFMLTKSVDFRIYAPSIEEPAIKHAGDLFRIPSIPVPGRGEYRISLGFPQQAREDLERFKPDIIHIATPDLLGISALKYAKRQGIPVVSSYHTNFGSYFSYYLVLRGLLPVFNRFQRWFYGQCEQVYVPSQSMADELHEAVDSTKIRLWERGVELDRFSPEHRSMEWRRLHGFDDNDVILTFVSRIVLEKDVDIYAHTVNKLKEKYPNVKALVVGDGPAANDMKKLLPNGVFTGQLKGGELSTAYASSDIFIFPSVTETFGNVTLEALASGIPALVADAPGGKSLIVENECGFIAKPKDVDDFAQKTALLLDHPEKLKAFSIAARKHAEEYSWENINGKLLGYYETVAKKPVKHS